MKKIIFCSFVLLLSNRSTSQNSNITFPNQAIYEDYSDSITDPKDAVKLVSDFTYFLGMDEKYQLKEVKYEKIKFLSEKGVHDHSIITIDTIYTKEDFDLKVRIIKPGGRHIDVDYSKLIREDCRYYKTLVLKVPDIAVNDELEYILEQRMKLKLSGQNYSLYSTIPVKKSSLTFVVNFYYEPVILRYNNFPSPEIKKIKNEYSATTNSLIYSWSARNLKGETFLESALPNISLPYMYFDGFERRNTGFNVINKFASWEEVFEQLANENFKEGTHESMKKITLKLCGTDGLADENSKLNSIVKLHTFINDSIKIIPYVFNMSKQLPEFFIGKKEIDEDNLEILYRSMFAYFGMKINYGMARSKYDGVMDSTIIAPEMLDYIFYTFTLDNIEYQLFTKNKVTTYALNEIPLSLQGATGILYNAKTKKTKIYPFPNIDKSFNSKKNKTIVNIKSGATNITAYSTVVFSGNFASHTRNTFDFHSYVFNDQCFQNYVMKKYDLTSIDSIQLNDDKKNIPPFIYSIKYNYHPEIAFSNEKTCNIPLKHLISNEIIEAESSRTLDYYFDFFYTDDGKYYLIFDKNVEIPNPEQFNIKASNDFGNYTFSIKQLNPTTIMINSAYDINKLKLPKENANLVKELYDVYQKALTTNFTINILN